MRIAMATDFSEQAEYARGAAVALARRLAAPITLIHSVEPDATAAGGGERGDEAARLRLVSLADAVRKAGVTVGLEIVRGYAEEVIVDAARRIDARLLVVGTHGRRAPLRWLLGSVAERTLQTSELPVLVVGDGGGAFAAWADGARPLRVTVALESAEPAEQLLEVARMFQRAGACVMTFVHVASRALLTGQLLPLLDRAFRARLAELGGKVDLIADGGGLANEIAAYLRDHPCDVTVVGVHPRVGFDFQRTAELARSLLHRRCGPVLAVPLAPATAAVDQAAPGLRSILVPTDLSELGNRAAAYAYAVSRGGSVTLLYVHQTPAGIVIPIDAQRRADLELRLLALVPSDADTRGISTNIIIVEGETPAGVIVDTATRLGCDIICMGSHGRSGLGRVVMGSVAENVVRRFAKAVLIVR